MFNELIWIMRLNMELYNHFIPQVNFYTPWKQQKIPGFLMISRVTERDQWYEMGWSLFSSYVAWMP